MRNLQKKETEKHQLILGAAAELFARQGYRKTTIDEIVQGAGISKGLFYHYFPNKQQLYIHLYNAYTDLLSRSIREKVDTGERDFFRRLEQITQLRIDFVTAYPHLYKFLYSAYFEQHPDVAPLIKDKNETLLRESHHSSAANIDWSKLKPGLSPDRAIELVTWVAEGFVAKLAANRQTDNTATSHQFREYLDYLKTGLYEERR